MVLIVAKGKNRYSEMMINRTIQSGGSVGGNKKQDIVNHGPSWPLNSVSLQRAPKHQVSIAFNLYHTTRYPVQQSGATIARLRLM